MTLTRTCILGIAFLAPAMAADSRVKLESLPAPVQTAIRAQAANATILDISKETEKGKTTFEVETKVNGKTRDFNLDAAGAVLVIEEEVDLDSVPVAARTALQKRAGSGTIDKVEKVTAGSTISYEAAIKSKAGKKSELSVNADGSPHKD